MSFEWSNKLVLSKKKYTCGYCSALVGPTEGYAFGYYDYTHYTEIRNYIYICPSCNKPTHFDVGEKKQTPGELYGNDVLNLPEDIKILYNEARESYSINAFTAVAMITRKIIMNTAVNEGAETNQNYLNYIDYLDRENIIPRNAKNWLNKLRKIGNEANHEIQHISVEEAQDAIKFVEILLKNVFEMSIDD